MGPIQPWGATMESQKAEEQPSHDSDAAQRIGKRCFDLSLIKRSGSSAPDHTDGYEEVDDSDGLYIEETQDDLEKEIDKELQRQLDEQLENDMNHAFEEYRREMDRVLDERLSAELCLEKETTTMKALVGISRDNNMQATIHKVVKQYERSHISGAT